MNIWRIIGWSAGLGLSLGWIAMLCLRLSIDQRNPFSVVECYIPVCLGVCCLVGLWKTAFSLPPKEQSKTKSFLQYTSMFGSLMGGVLFAFAWQAQVVLNQADWLIARHVTDANSTMSVARHMFSDEVPCSSQVKWMEVMLSEQQSFTSLEKLTVREKIMDMYTKQCISDRRVFEYVQLLRYMPIRKQVSPSATFGYIMSPRLISGFSMETESIALTEKEWCLHQNKENSVVQKSCDKLGTLPLSSPPKKSHP